MTYVFPYVYIYVEGNIYIYRLRSFADAFGPNFVRNGALWVLRFCERNLHAYFWEVWRFLRFWK